MYTHTTKGVGRNFSRGGLSEAPGEGSQPFFNFQGGGGSTPIFCRFNGQNERIFGPEGGGHGPPCLCLPTPLNVPCRVLLRIAVVLERRVVCSFVAILNVVSCGALSLFSKNAANTCIGRALGKQSS